MNPVVGNIRRDKWDFKNLRMKFEVKGKRLVLRGGSSSVELKTINVKQLDKLLPYSSKCSLVQWYRMKNSIVLPME